MRLLRNKNNGAVVDWSPSMAALDNMVELSPQEIRDYMAGPSVVKANAGQPADYGEEGVVFYMSGTGIGDAVSSLYAAEGIARAGHRVKFHTPHADWLQGVMPHENLTVVGSRLQVGANCNTDYQDQLRTAASEGVSRSQWYIRQLAKAYPIDPSIPPARPILVDKVDAVDRRRVLAPFAHHTVRQWPLQNWVRLAKLLGNAVVIGSGKDEAACREFFAPAGIEYQLDKSPAHVITLLRNAELLVSVESGMAHVAGLYGVRTYSLVSQTGPGWLYDCAPTVTVIMPSEKWDCVGCHWQEDRGYMASCHTGCGALMSISPFQVAESATNRVESKPVKRAKK